MWLGLTLQCARCHDHKFDPTSNRDYFAFYDFFNQTTESGAGKGGLAVPPAMEYLAKDRRELLEQARNEVAMLKSQTSESEEQAQAREAAEAKLKN